METSSKENQLFALIRRLAVTLGTTPLLDFQFFIVSISINDSAEPRYLLTLLLTGMLVRFHNKIQYISEISFFGGIPSIQSNMPWAFPRVREGKPHKGTNLFQWGNAMKKVFLFTIGCLLALSFALSTCWADTPKASPQDADFELSGASWQGPFRVAAMMTVYSNGTWYWRAYLNNGRALLDSFGNRCDQAILLTAFMKDADLWVYMDDKAWGNVSLNRAQ